MRTFPAIAAALLLASGAVVAATMTDDPGQAAKSSPKVRVEVSPDGDRVEAIVNGVVDDEQGERVRRLAVLGGRGGHLGVSVKDVDPSVQGRSGAIVEEVREGSAAEKAGIRAGDVIAEFDGERVRGVRHLTRLVSETPEGRSVKAVVERDGKRVELTVTPESSAMAYGGRDLELVVPPMRFERLPGVEKELRRELERSLPREGTWSFRGRPGEVFGFRMNERGRLGVSVQPLEGQLAEYFGTSNGVLVNSVEKDSPAAKAGLKAGDVVTAVNGRAVSDPAALIDAVRDADDGATLSIDIVRDKKPQSLKAELEKREAVEMPKRRQPVRPI
jgi:membrane-associated protease RseP (regulator of RpoE activity)